MDVAHHLVFRLSGTVYNGVFGKMLRQSIRTHVQALNARNEDSTMRPFYVIGAEKRLDHIQDCVYPIPLFPQPQTVSSAKAQRMGRWVILGQSRRQDALRSEPEESQQTPSK
ncbi:hypothetical protein B0O80DRAFT_430665 [Mortierella sp. GBAus27b]|nr:hypothetical protein B0O80DRAFT_430665 [Mortierella sp. GBAus27b]